MVNGAMAAAGQEQVMSTLDVCDIDLYTGKCEFVKVGAASTYIKRGRLVDRLSSRNLPLGVFLADGAGNTESNAAERRLCDYALGRRA